MLGQELQRDLIEDVRILSLHTVSCIRYHYRCRKFPALPHFIVKELKFLWTFIPRHEQHWKIKLLDVGACADRAVFVPQRRVNICRNISFVGSGNLSHVPGPLIISTKISAALAGSSAFKFSCKGPDERFCEISGFFGLGSLRQRHLDAAIRQHERSNNFGVRFRYLDCNRATPRVSNEVHLPEVQFLTNAATSGRAVRSKNRCPCHPSVPGKSVSG